MPDRAGRRQVGLPDALREPQPPRLDAEAALEGVAQPEDLLDTVGLGSDASTGS